jgi:drug/metabolite transporter (DMT)-like permease
MKLTFLPKKKTLLFVLYFILLWGGQLSSKRASEELTLVNIYFIPLYLCFFSRAIVWFLILKNMGLIKAYTISSINYLFMPLISFFIFGELLQSKHFIGGLFIISGIIIYRVGEYKTT